MRTLIIAAIALAGLYAAAAACMYYGFKKKFSL